MRIGYARVSTNDQNLDLQLDALRIARCDRIFEDQASGSRADRPGLAAAVESAGKGDVLVVWRLDRLGRSLPHLIDVVANLANRGIGFQSLTECVDTTSAGGKLVFHIFGALAEFERSLIRERTNAGLQAARSRGRIGGRPRAMTVEKVTAARRLLRDGTAVRDVASAIGVSVPTLYRWLPASEVLRVGAE
ncbi:MAG: recombinase family protein [Alphaproteobacteria bacterium]|nr:recombinase family protein [Alphaproteobacteria bacterium]